MVLNNGYGKSVDFWALGVLSYELLFFEVPFSSTLIRSSKFLGKCEERSNHPDWPTNNVSDEGKDFIHNLLKVNP